MTQKRRDAMPLEPGRAQQGQRVRLRRIGKWGKFVSVPVSASAPLTLYTGLRAPLGRHGGRVCSILLASRTPSPNLRSAGCRLHCSRLRVCGIEPNCTAATAPTRCRATGYPRPSLFGPVSKGHETEEGPHFLAGIASGWWPATLLLYT